MFRITGVAFAAILLGTAAPAATFTFDGMGSIGGTTSINRVEDGLAVSVTAQKYNTPGMVGSAFVSQGSTDIAQNSWGLIIDRNNDEHVIDGKNGNEIVLFDFGTKIVELTTARFRYTSGYNFRSNSVFDLFVDGIFAGQSTYANAASLFMGKTGSVFGIGASNHRTGFKLAEISANVVAPVPVPAAGLMLLAGLGALGAVKRRKSA